MPTGLLTVSQYAPEPPIQIPSGSTTEVRGWYAPRSFIAGDGVTVVESNSSNGENGFYYVIGTSINLLGNLVVEAHEIQATTLSNPTANYFEGLWINGSFFCYLMPSSPGASGWQIPTVYGDPIAFDEIATYNRAKRLLYPPNTYFTADMTIQEILRLAGNFDYMAVNINGIGSASVAPLVASEPIVLMENDQRVMDSVVDVTKAPFYATGDGVTDDTAAIQAALNLFAYNGSRTGGMIWFPDGVYCVTGLTYRGGFATSFIMQGASTGAGFNGVTLKYTGTVGGKVIELLGANYCQIRDIGIDGGSVGAIPKALVGLAVDFDSSRGLSSFNCQFKNIVVGAVSGVNSVGISVGAANLTSAEHSFIDCNVVGHFTAGSTYYGMKIGLSNTKNIRVVRGGYASCKWGISIGNSGYKLIEGVSFASNVEGDFQAVGAECDIVSCGSEGSGRLIDGSGTSASIAGRISVKSSYWAGTTVSDDYFIIYPGALLLEANAWWNGRTATSECAIKSAQGNAGTTFVSINNNYGTDATTTSIPLFNSSDVRIYEDNTSVSNRRIFSFGDVRAGFGGGASNLNYPTWLPDANLGGSYRATTTAGAHDPLVGDAFVGMSAALGDASLNLGTAASAGQNKRFTLIKTDSTANIVTLFSASANINGSDRVVLYNQYDFVVVVSDGTIYRVVAQSNTLSAGATLSISGNAITVTNPIHHVGAGLIKNINAASNNPKGPIYLIPDAAFTTDATGNIGKASTAVVGVALSFVFDGTDWWPSY